MTDQYDFALDALRQADPWPAELRPHQDEWTTGQLLAHIEVRSSAVETGDLGAPPAGDTNSLRPPPWRRGLVIAAAVFLAVALIGGALLSLQGRDTAPPVTEPPTTTAAPTTTVASTTTPPTTAAETTTAPSTTSVPATTAVVTTLPPPTFDAVVSWDGETCVFDGPAEIPAGSILNITWTNNSDDLVDFRVGYMTEGSTMEDLIPWEGLFDTTSRESQPPFVIQLASFPERSLGIGESGEQTLAIGVPRLHIFVCFGGPAAPVALDQLINISDTGMTVTG